MSLVKHHVVALLTMGLFISLCGCAVFAYLWVDRSIALSYANASLRASEDINTSLVMLIQSEWRNLTKKEILEKLEFIRKNYSKEDVFIKEEQDGSVWFGGVSFHFESGRLKSIEK
ncbi:MAG: immunity protein 58 [Burkholderiales bacterium]|nr:immunity protein 58 [Burkholderiales bacterium]